VEIFADRGLKVRGLKTKKQKSEPRTPPPPPSPPKPATAKPAFFIFFFSASMNNYQPRGYFASYLHKLLAGEANETCWRRRTNLLAKANENTL